MTRRRLGGGTDGLVRGLLLQRRDRLVVLLPLRQLHAGAALAVLRPRLEHAHLLRRVDERVVGRHRWRDGVDERVDGHVARQRILRVSMHGIML